MAIEAPPRKSLIRRAFSAIGFLICAALILGLIAVLFYAYLAFTVGSEEANETFSWFAEFTSSIFNLTLKELQ